MHSSPSCSSSQTGWSISGYLGKPKEGKLWNTTLNTGNVFAKRCAQDLSVAELKSPLRGGCKGPKQATLLRSSYSSNKTKSEVQDSLDNILYLMTQVVFG